MRNFGRGDIWFGIAAAMASALLGWLVVVALEPGTNGVSEAASASRTTPTRTAAPATAAAATTAARAVPSTVRVRVDASARPTFLCVENEGGKQLFSGMLVGEKTFSGRHLKLNVGLASTVVTVDGKRVPLTGSPTGLDVTAANGPQPLAPTERPCG